MIHARVCTALLSLLALLAIPAASASAAGLGGSRNALRDAYDVARQSNFTFLRTASQVQEYVAKAELHEVRSNEHLLVSNVSFPYARGIVKLFIERLAEQYHRMTGERLVVTSLTRPTTLQPRNASPLSVHPAGMAVDLRIPRNAIQRSWLEETLLSLEAKGLLDVTRERRPPHYHVAVFPAAYAQYLGVVAPAALAALLTQGAPAPGTATMAPLRPAGTEAAAAAATDAASAANGAAAGPWENGAPVSRLPFEIATLLVAASLFAYTISAVVRAR